MSRVVYTEIDVSTATSQVVTSAEAKFIGAWVTTALSAHAVDVTDGAGGTVVRQFPASSGVNTEVEGHGVYMANGIVLACNASGTGKIIVAFEVTD